MRPPRRNVTIFVPDLDVDARPSRPSRLLSRLLTSKVGEKGCRLCPYDCYAVTILCLDGYLYHTIHVVLSRDTSPLRRALILPGLPVHDRISAA